MTTTEPRLTRKGWATRQRIIEAAADLMYEHGVKGTNNDLIRQAAGVSGSQLSHYFPDKESLVRAVLDWQADAMMGAHSQPPRGELDSVAALRAWAASYLGPGEPWRGGCRFGSLAGEVLKTEPALRDDVVRGFGRWRDQFRGGLLAMRDRGELRADTDIDRLAYVLMTAFQGGLLLAQATGDPAPLRAALDTAVGEVARHAVA
ncbi:TetR/AcrR family transcriptional regulator [Amycolatopsis sp. NPDC101161]|uniref:TetR/AcrR family transcriptional regulator n=1 Tax=Amycolatopsis sp. NPDC101161 TaxID=3363940 RepID=UPI0037F6DBB0